tara:strand:+ start:190 stop:372 length:183 start_codon:yes stop_codon:yes gene_type:complete
VKVGDLVQHCFSEKIGVTIREVFDSLCATTINKVFDILWLDGTIGHNVWNYDLEVISESR